MLCSAGITPAYAGNTPTEQSILSVFGDHPRLRGEHFLFNTVKFIPAGSPPPTRGTPYVRVPLTVQYGITPAYAGNTIVPYRARLYHKDHPRLRGEHRV